MVNFEDPIKIEGRNNKEFNWEVGATSKENKIDFAKAKLELLQSGKKSGFFFGLIVTEKDIEGETIEKLESELEELNKLED
ncbi:MAG: hypothetical protein PHZ07_04955 [Patescibacteria group bacterium]|nr:hypothetical protein [Patescibacteria group bacterium]MDD4304704.1 hypothetical protein [Patescibacteria group bacterium]MDD4695734.1 hypothetical protein [Patescibacteria group bacterium]